MNEGKLILIDRKIKLDLFLQIREEEILSKLKRVVKEEGDLVQSFKFLNPVDDNEERERIIRRLQELKREENRVRSLSDDDLFDGDCDEYDWMKISAQCFDGHISPQSCRSIDSFLGKENLILIP